jgi:hypothetical protein
VTVGTDDAVTDEWTVSELETVQVTNVSDGVEFDAPG